MKRARSPAALAALLCGLLQGCGSSPPVRYFVLRDIPGAQVAPAPAPAAASAADSRRVPVRLEPIHVPPELDRVEVVSRIGPERLRIADSDLWAAPLEDQIRGILSSDLSSRLPPRTIADPNEPISDEPRRLLSVAILEFLGDGSCRVRLRADWTLRAPDGSQQRGAESVQIPGTVSCDGAPAAEMSRALAALADRLAAIIRG